MSKHEKFNFNSLQAIEEKVKALNVDIQFD